jgi:hypothetical protein
LTDAVEKFPAVPKVRHTRLKEAKALLSFHVSLGIASLVPSSPRRLGRCVARFIRDTHKNGLEG